MELPQLGSRGQAELLAKPEIYGAVDGERLGGPAAPVQREHQLRMQRLPQRLAAGQSPQLGNQFGVAAKAQFRVHA
jgi:hypothetical protein